MRIGNLIVFICLLAISPSTIQAESARETPVVKVVRNQADAVVNIGTERIVYLKNHPIWGSYGNAFDPHFDLYFQRPQILNAVKMQSIGSGVVVRPDGLIATNAHVIHMASKIYARFLDGKTVPANLVGIDTANDLALIKVETEKPLHAVEFADYRELMIGETVVAIGNPFGFENSVTVGVVSGKQRNFFIPQTKLQIQDAIQTDAPINVGNSGGPLFDLDGRLVGVNLSVVMEANNIGFAIPAFKVQKILEAYERHLNESAHSSAGQAVRP